MKLSPTPTDQASSMMEFVLLVCFIAILSIAATRGVGVKVQAKAVEVKNALQMNGDGDECFFGGQNYPQCSSQTGH